jgi:hypothetical protein
LALRGPLGPRSATFASAARHRNAVDSALAERAATDGTVEDLGAFHSLWFTDPDGMRGELILIVDHALGGIHAPTPVPAP